MIKFLNTYRLQIVFVVLIAILYFVLRLPNLTLQPIFADEAIYIRWAQVMRAEPTLRFLPLSDGKTPLFMWVMTPLFKIFEDPLLAGRFLSVLSGFASLVGVLFLGWKFFNCRVALWSALLVAIVPYMVFFDRMALVDSMLAAFSIWALNLTLLLIKYQRLDIAMFLGYILGGGLLTKPPGFFNFLSLPTTLVVFNWGDKDRQQKFLRLFFLIVVSIIIAQIIYNILRLGPGFDSLSRRNQDYIFSPLELVGRPLDPFIPHLKDLADWLPKLLTIPILMLMMMGAVWGVAARHKIALAIFLWGIVPLLIQAALLRTFTARYLLFSFLPLLVLGGWMISYLIDKIKVRGWGAVLILLMVILPLALSFDVKLITNPTLAPLPKEERRGYLEDWTAGYGFVEIARFLIQEAQKEIVVVGTEGSFGTLPDGLQIYLDKYFHQAPKEKQILISPGKATISAELRQSAATHPTFFVTNKSRFPEFTSGLSLLKEYPKAQSEDFPQDAILLFQVFPDEGI